MDETTRRLASYVAGLQYGHLGERTLRETKNRLVDAIGCAFGGFRSEPAAIARRVAAAQHGDPPARVFGTGALTTMEMAAFANSAMVRYLDFNDTYISIGSGHPSDMIPACLAVADALHADGRSALVSIVAAYEVFTGLADVIRLRDRGWDQGVIVVLGAAAGAAKLLGLTEAQIADALAIAVSANIPTRQTRAGELAMWKGCATAAAARAGVFAALLAREGMTGPTAAFEGRHGLWEQVSGPFELPELARPGGAYGIERTNLKFFPSEYHSQAPLWMALELRRKVAVADIESIDIRTYWTTYSEIGSEPEKWAPRTRETADHSLPFLLAVALTEGRITTASFDDAHLADPGLRALMQRIRIEHDESYTREFPAKMISRIELATRTGQRFVEMASYPRGHALNPMTDAEVEAKFANVSEGLLAPQRRDRLIAALRRFEQANDVGAVLELIRVDD